MRDILIVTKGDAETTEATWGCFPRSNVDCCKFTSFAYRVLPVDQIESLQLSGNELKKKHCQPPNLNLGNDYHCFNIWLSKWYFNQCNVFQKANIAVPSVVRGLVNLFLCEKEVYGWHVIHILVWKKLLYWDSENGNNIRMPILDSLPRLIILASLFG